MEREDLSATSWMSSRAFVALLFAVGVFYLIQPDWLGYGWLAEKLGSETRLHGVGLFAAFALLASQSWEIAQVRVRMAQTNEALHQLLYGKDFRRDREAIDVLLTALESQTGESAKSAYSHLVRLTGQNFAQDPKVWRAWWEANKKAFEKAR